MQRLKYYTLALTILSALASSRNSTSAPPRQLRAASLNETASRAAGVLVKSNAKLSPHLERTLLLVVCNSGQLEALLNWRCVADALGLKYLVVAMDADVATWSAAHAPAGRL